MLTNYLKIAWRNIVKRKVLSIITTLCLAIGLTFSLIIGIYVVKQKNINSDLRNTSQQYLLKSNWKKEGMGLDITTLGPLAKTLHEEYPHLVSNYYRYNPVTNIISAGNRHFKEEIAIGDTTFVSMYGLPLLHGNPHRAFINNNSAVITASMAIRLFGTTEALGKVITMNTTLADQKQVYTVSAVLKDMPYNSVFSLVGDSYNVFVPTTGNNYYGTGDPAQSWDQLFEIGLVELQSGKTPEDLATPVKNVLKKYTSQDIQGALEVVFASVRNYHLDNPKVKNMILSLLLIAVFILLMAVINYVNIHIGTSTYRVKEIGLRKVFGSRKKQLITQFMTESLIITLLAAAIAILFYESLLGFFEGLLHTAFPHWWEFDTAYYLYAALLVLAVALVAGLYPAFVLSRFNMTNAVKGKMSSAQQGSFLRKSLLTTQFALATIVFIIALNVSRQMNYTFSKDLGYQKEGLMTITAFPKQWDSAGVKKMETIKEGLKQLSVVRNASISFEIPDRKPPNPIEIAVSPGNPAQNIFIGAMGADKEYAATFGIKLLSGAFFTQEGEAPFGDAVLNAAAVKEMGFDNSSVIGRQFAVTGFPAPITIRGVVADYNYSSLQEKIEPVIFLNYRDLQAFRYITVKLAATDMQQAISQVRDKWQALSPQSPFEYIFIEDKVKSLYRSELQLRSATTLASLLNLVIIFMGVFGVVSFTLTRRTREIGVRKVIGAKVKDIILLFIKDYFWPVALANIIAWPVAYMASAYWLQNYSYRIEQNVFTYLFAAVLLFGIVSVFITLQCMETARRNPVKALRTE